MKFNKWFLPAILVTSVVALASLPALAGHHEGGEGKTCPISGKGGSGCDKGGMKSDCGKGGCNKGGCDKMGMGGMKGAGCSHAASHCPIANKFCSKVCWLMEHKDDLSLTDEQVAKIKELDLEVEKNTIRGMSEMKIFTLEMESRLSQSPINVESIESMIDSGMAGMATGAKATVKAYAELKTVLTEEQIAKAKELKKGEHAGHHHHKA